MKVWLRSKGQGPHFAAGITIAPQWTEAEVSEETKQMLCCIESIDVSETGPAGGKPVPAPDPIVVEEEEESTGLFGKRKKKKG